MSQNSFQDVALDRLKCQKFSYIQNVKRKPTLLLSLQHFCQKLYEHHDVLHITEN